MNGDSKRTQSFFLKKSVLISVLILAVLMTAVVGTMAWLRNVRSLQTVTQVVVTDLSLKGPSDYTIAIDIGGIDVKQPDSSTYVFGVRSNNVDSFRVQLGYTTNLPLTYTIYPENNDGQEITEAGGTTFHYDANQPLAGAYLNTDGTSPLANSTLHNKTYDEFNNVQKNAEPVYWRSEQIGIDRHSIKYFVLKISWDQELPNNKETDMIYLTVGTGSSSTSGGSQS